MITVEQIEKRRQEIIAENQAAAERAKKEAQEKARSEVLDFLARDNPSTAALIADRADILWEIPEEYLLVAARQIAASYSVEICSLIRAKKIYEHFSKTTEAVYVERLIEEEESKQHAREMVEGLTR